MKPPSKSWLALAVAVTVAIAPLAIQTAYAGPKDDARLHYKQGATLFSAGKYRDAIAEFAKANALAPSSVLEFNIGLCHDRLGEKQEALRRYRNYLHQQPNASNAAVVRDKIQRLEGEIAADKAAATRPAPPVVDPTPTPGPAPPVVDPTPVPDPGPAEPAPVPTPDEPVYDTGDPALDRVGNMSIVAIRNQYRQDYGATGSSPAPPVSDNAVPPPPSGGAVPPPASDNEAPPPPTDTGKKKDKPAYKKWWFWVVVGVSAVILINIASSDSSNNGALMENLPGSPSSGMGASPVLLRF